MKDTAIIYGGLMFFIVTSLFLTAFNEELNISRGENNIEDNLEDLKSSGQTSLKSNPSTVEILKSAGTFFLNLFKVMTFTFGSVPLLVDLILLMPIRILFWFVVIRQIVGSGN